MKTDHRNYNVLPKKWVNNVIKNCEKKDNQFQIIDPKVTLKRKRATEKKTI